MEDTQLMADKTHKKSRETRSADNDEPDSEAVAVPVAITGQAHEVDIESPAYQAEMVRRAAQIAARSYRQRGEPIPPHVSSALQAGRQRSTPEPTSGRKSKSK